METDSDFHCKTMQTVSVETVSDFIFLASKITADGDCSHEIKRHLLLGRKVRTNPDSILKNRDITLPTKVHLAKAMVFPVAMYGYESWTVKKAECQRIDAFELWFLFKETRESENQVTTCKHCSVLKVETEKVGLKLNIQKTKIMASCPITSWQIDGEIVETVADFIFLGSKITADGDYNHEIK